MSVSRAALTMPGIVTQHSASQSNHRTRPLYQSLICAPKSSNLKDEDPNPAPSVQTFFLCFFFSTYQKKRTKERKRRKTKRTPELRLRFCKRADLEPDPMDPYYFARAGSEPFSLDPDPVLNFVWWLTLKHEVEPAYSNLQAYTETRTCSFINKILNFI